MNPSSPSRRGALGALALTVALTGGTLPATGPAFAAEPATYALTIQHIGRSGAPTGDYETMVRGISGPGAAESVTPHDPTGTVTVRLPRGRYLLESTLTTGASGAPVDWVVQPRLDLDGDTTVTVDARTTAPVDVRPPDPAAAFYVGSLHLAVTHGGATESTNVSVTNPELRVAHLGPDAEPGSVRQWYDSYWPTPDGAYALGYHFADRSRALDGLTRHPAREDLATLKVRGAALADSTGALVGLHPSPGPAIGYGNRLRTPGTGTYLVTPERGTWGLSYDARDAAGTTVADYSVEGFSLRAGQTRTLTFDNGVFGPDLTGRAGAVRDGNRIAVDVPLLTDGDGHLPWSSSNAVPTTTLYRDGVPVAPGPGTPNGPRTTAFTVPPGRADYRLTSTVRRPGAPGLRPGVTAEWTFSSDTTGGPEPLPLGAVRFSPALSLLGTAKAYAPLRVPVSVTGAAQGRVRSLAVSYSVDGGASWKRLPVEGGAVTVPNPRAGTRVALRAELTDTAGNTLTQTAIDAYRTQ
ncbi:hypothetical protein [Streptomyces clavuligerus]|uniref:Subtilisin-like protease n=1 Tax=Streptomyces clavuligerus TaxID=1901 RepID=E2Q8A4_STRCL|nr:hypothetical protein [Streptomyces clavuligerus]ANW21416.1 serine protease [Streptomyces clavuligerus]AXU16048.1 serine protease [Streptomyces clavuligerus]EFG05436.1 subtilisin-like protease [Streptomyces clavuligerus]MBY6306183.1 serine protease [Streptomyces clavuligerus]QCS08826.1 serine protease [Streptomyces clavuligerus]